MGTINVNKKIKALEGLRGIAFFCVLLCHSELFGKISESLGAWGVSVFLVLNGFLMTYNYYDKNRLVEPSLKNNFLLLI